MDELTREAANYRLCTRCVMDSSAPDLTFDASGVCNFCEETREIMARQILPQDQRERKRQELINRCLDNGKGKPYDCVVGVSGGVDSSYMLHLAKLEFGLRPLAVHLDNGWNGELANNNIERIVNGVGVDLFTHVIDWEENRDMQRSYFKAHVINIEALMDNAMLAVNYRMARCHKLNTILAGTNASTEGFRMPKGWSHDARDKKNIKAIQKRFGTIPIRTHWLQGHLDYLIDKRIFGVQWISGLDYVDYVKAQALEVLKDRYGYRPYPYKHYESIFTRFYQGYILPKKFGVDKRRVHLSTLVVSGQMTRDMALKHFETSPYPDAKLLHEDLEYVLKRLGFSRGEFEAYLAAPAVPHTAYPSESAFYERLYAAVRRLRIAFGGRMFNEKF